MCIREDVDRREIKFTHAKSRISGEAAKLSSNLQSERRRTSIKVEKGLIGLAASSL